MKEITKAQNKQQGFSLLESMLALFVLTVGLLGVAAMHSQSLSTGYVAMQRMSAVSKGEELFERMRSNPAGLDEYVLANATPHACSVTDVCTPTLMAQDDLNIWSAEVDAMFPGTPTKVITLDTLANTIDPTGNVRAVTISITWASKGDSYNYTASTEIAP